MNPQNSENIHGYSNHGGIMDIMKTHMMTYTMMKSLHNPTSNDGGGGSGIMGLLYIFIATAAVDFLCKSLFPAAAKIANEYYHKNFRHAHLLKDLNLHADSEKTKTSSITIHVNVSDSENRYGQALLDYITNNNNTKHIRYKKQNFILNQTDVIEICEDIFICLKENEELDGGMLSTNGTGSSANTGGAQILQTIELFSYTKTTHDLRQFLNRIAYDYDIKLKNKLGDDIFYFNQHPMNAPRMTNGEKDYSKLANTCTFTMKKFQTNRRFANLFGPEIAVVRKRVDFFIKHRKWYDAKGIPYTLGLLLSGQAGAGKTSTVKCLGNETGRHIININLNNDITKTQMENLFYNEVISVINNATGQTEKYSIPLEQRIYVLEDIDCQSDLVMDRDMKNGVTKETPHSTNPVGKRGKEQKEALDVAYHHNRNDMFPGAEKIDLSFLLNLLDGVLEIPGRIVIMTSNYINMLDKALIRPGRIDVIADFKKCTNDTLLEMIEFFYEMKMDDFDFIKNDIVQRIRGLKEYIISPAEMSKLMFENMDDYRKVVSTLEMKSMEFEEKEKEKQEYDEEYEKQEFEKEKEEEKQKQKEEYDDEYDEEYEYEKEKEKEKEKYQEYDDKYKYTNQMYLTPSFGSYLHEDSNGTNLKFTPF